MYIASSLIVGRMLFRGYKHREGTLLYIIGLVYISPLLLLGWLQNQATKGLDKWFEMAEKE